jgi:uncharacterized membrane protein YfcA
MALSAFLGALIGAILGLTGAGGGILAVPALAVGMHWTMQQAAPVALIAVALGAAVGAFEGLRHGLVRYKAAVLIAVSGFPLVYLGQMLAHDMSQPALQAGFSMVMLVIAFRLYRQVRFKSESDSGVLFAKARVNPESGKFIWSMTTVAVLASIGGATGFMTGLLGVGGGFVIVPMLRKFTEVSIEGIVATSLMVIALVGASGVVSAVLRHTAVPWGHAAVFSATTVLGMLAGRRLIKKISPIHVQLLFAAVLTLVAFGLLFSASSVLVAWFEHALSAY